MVHANSSYGSFVVSNVSVIQEIFFYNIRHPAQISSMQIVQWNQIILQYLRKI